MDVDIYQYILQISVAIIFGCIIILSPAIRLVHEKEIQNEQTKPR